MAGIIDRIRENVERKGGKKGSIFFVKKDVKKRIRLLRDMDDAVEIVIHDQFPGKTVPCLKHFGEECPYCSDAAYRTRSNFGWPIWSYDDGDNGAVKLLLYKANDQTPIKPLLDFFEEYESVTDRDFTIKRTGEGFDTRYGVIPGNIGKLPKEIRAAIKEAGGIWDDDKIIELVGEAFDVEDEIAALADDDDDDEKPAKKKKDKAEKPKSKKKEEAKEVEDDDDDDFEDDDDD